MEFSERNGKLCLGDVSFEEVAERFGTPFYLYDLDAVRDRAVAVKRAFGDAIELLYAVKANPNPELLRGIADSVDGLDIASTGELHRAMAAGFRPEAISFAGPGKTRAELGESIRQGVGIISVESVRELRDLKALAEAEGVRAPVTIRINPALITKEFAIKMGGKATQFGIDEEDTGEAVVFLRANERFFDVLGIHVYAGTQCLDEEALATGLANTLRIAAEMRERHGIECRVINIGGGFGVSYYDEGRTLDLGLLARLYTGEFDRYRRETGTKPRFLLELGRYLVAEAGIYVARVISEKRSRGERFHVLDGGMNHHLSASGNLGATLRKNYLVRNLSRPGAEKKTSTLVGPLCTPLDLMGKGVSVESPQVGDLMGFLNSGSYGYSASPLLFLGHEPPKEIILSGGCLKVGNGEYSRH
jgi:diaminopimelate decarboxylase